MKELVQWARGCAQRVQEWVSTDDPHECSDDALSFYSGADDFADWMWDEGYTCLGAGVFSAAFETPHSEYVLKIGFAAKHDGGLEWQHFCHEYHSTLPMLPEVVHVESFGGDFYFVLVRRYDELTSSEMNPEEVSAWLCCQHMLCAEEEPALEYFPDCVLDEDDWACLELLQEITRELGYRVDFHSGNCLWEWDNEGIFRRPIINDPFSYSLDEDY